MSRPSERDCLTALSIAALLGVELEPWQEVVLQQYLAMHREILDAPPAVATAAEMAGHARLTCPNVSNDPDPDKRVRCQRSFRHLGQHEAGGVWWSRRD